MKKFALCMTAALSVCAAQAQVKWDLPTGYGANSFQTQNVQQSIHAVYYRNSALSSRIRSFVDHVVEATRERGFT